jgi:hypothetical protein
MSYKKDKPFIVRFHGYPRASEYDDGWRGRDVQAEFATRDDAEAWMSTVRKDYSVLGDKIELVELREVVLKKISVG